MVHTSELWLNSCSLNTGHNTAHNTYCPVKPSSHRVEIGEAILLLKTVEDFGDWRVISCIQRLWGSWLLLFHTKESFIGTELLQNLAFLFSILCSFSGFEFSDANAQDKLRSQWWHLINLTPCLITCGIWSKINNYGKTCYILWNKKETYYDKT